MSVMEIVGQTLGFWVGLVAAIFILLHIPSCNAHWAQRLKPLSSYLKRHHALTLNLATLFAIVHVILAVVGLTTRVWI
jgi:membrane protein DedA with SNARE-associated domain